MTASPPDRHAADGEACPPDPRSGAVIYVGDIDRVSEFYAAVLQVRPAGRDDQYVLLAAGPVQLVILTTPAAAEAGRGLTQPPQRRTETAVKPVFWVDSIDRVRAAAGQLGGQIDPPDQQWRFGGDLVCDGCDPEGNVLQLRQPLT